MFTRFARPAAAAVFLVASLASAHAAGVGGLAKGLERARVHIVAERPALAPFAFVRLCKKAPEHCAPAAGAREVEATAERLAELAAVNKAVNRAIRPAADKPGKGYGDEWTVDPTKGDCEDYALSKRHRLVAAGWPAAALRLAVVRTSTGEGHAVLVVRTSDGDLVLDNLTDRVKPWTRTGLRFVLIQSGEQPRRWFAL